MQTINHLLRDHAPIPTHAWEAIDEEARQRLTPLLAARRIADWVGPGGWRHDAMTLGRTITLDGPAPGITVGAAHAKQRRVLPLTEIKVPFTISREDIDDIQRGAIDTDFIDLDRAARDVAMIETRAVLHGWPSASIRGIAEATSYSTGELGSDITSYPSRIATGVDRMRGNGITGPYAAVVGPQIYTQIVETTEHGGYLLIDHLERELGGPVVWAPGVDGAIVVSQRGGDFLLDVGQDISVGYSHHDAEQIYLYFEESMAFRIIEPDAAFVLT